MSETPKIEFSLGVDETGLGRVIVGGKYYGLPAPAIRHIVRKMTDAEQSRWIPVKERAPNIQGRYLVADAYGSRWIGAYHGNGKWENQWVEYWMPLPPMPEAERSED